MHKVLMPITVLGMMAFASSAQAATVQTTSAFDLGTAATIPGSIATLSRDGNTLDLGVSTNSLPEGAYTMWWVIFNNPNACVGGCGEDDFGIPEVNATAFYADGQVVGGNGLGNFSAFLTENTLPPPEQVLFGTGLENAFVAEILAVIRYHGPLSSDPALAELQLSTFNGGCTVTAGDGLFPCADLQGAVFPTATPEPASILGLISMLGVGVSLGRVKR